MRDAGGLNRPRRTPYLYETAHMELKHARLRLSTRLDIVGNAWERNEHGLRVAAFPRPVVPEAERDSLIGRRASSSHQLFNWLAPDQFDSRVFS